MTNDEFRTMALKIPAAVERSHMNHPDFRVAGKIFASLGVPDKSWGMVKLTPEQQRAFIEKAPKIFKPSSGSWGGRVTRMFIFPSQRRQLCALHSMQRQTTSVQRRRKRPTPINRERASNIARTTHNDSTLQGVLEKRVLESWLKRAWLGFANPKLRSNFELRGAVDFHIEVTVFCQ